MLHDIPVIPNLFIMFGKLFELITIIRLSIYTCLDEANPDFDKLGVFHAGQISMCLDPHLN